ncbi:LPS export ABC transporter permease LptG [Limoniibacter endophyticus]|uniref:LPS export ABC transporter permease LptG n=2 Tax=Limoniibacter endophyticus TaxID=1565040 RepID=A0A8J3GGZ9_9HYPH|nr:LPS export ABC transporter permease LptG [Limoniibacter endophyticus]
MGFTLGRYFLSRYLSITFWMFLGIFALVFIVTFTEFSSRTSGLANYNVQDALTVSILRVPMIMLQTVPFVGLFSAMGTLVSLNRKYELVVARAAGISAWQFLLPICLGALLFGIASVGILNPIAASGFARAEAIEVELRSGVASPGNNVIPWIRQTTSEGDTIVGAQATLDEGLTLVNASFFQFADNGDLTRRIDAERAYLRDGYWELQGIRQQRGATEIVENGFQIKTNLRPEFVQERLAQPETIPFYELPGKIEIARSFGLQANAFAMQFHSLVAQPMLLVAMTLIAATVSMRFVRMGQSAVMILGGIVAGFLLYVISVLVQAFGTAGFVPPAIAAWVPVAIAMFFGVTFLLHKEDG